MVALTLQPLNCGDWTTGADPELRSLGVSAIALHRGLYIDNLVVANTAWMAWRGLVAHGWRPLATSGPVTSFERGGSRARPPFPEPSRGDALFCQGWYRPDVRGRQMSRSHAAFWVYGRGILRLFVASPEPIRVNLSVDGRPHSSLTARRLQEVRIGLPRTGWHLVAFDTHGLPLIGGKPRGARIVAYALPRS